MSAIAAVIHRLVPDQRAAMTARGLLTSLLGDAGRSRNPRSHRSNPGALPARRRSPIEGLEEAVTE
jgi:hypothetical protein